ncbi:MAG TPA: glycosyltransferase family 4 protein [Xanthobacteraceae bacterium]|jgi:glycosyltransferase involved in cell wall biosynthesis|nr:glycosyltransferase family 4 protein [Xanthobacteraceae bacterium]
MGDVLSELRPTNVFNRLASDPITDSDITTGAFAHSRHSLKILHILRAPFGGLFRHVVDVTQGQIARGHRVGLIVDSMTGGARAEAALAELGPQLALGILRAPIRRQISWRDAKTLWTAARRIKLLAPDVLHGHGAKGAAIARLTFAAPDAIRAYTPHGGSLVYSPGTLSGGFYRSLERILNPLTDLFLFESGYVAELFRTRIGRPRAMVRVVRNGISEAEFEPIPPRPDATDLVCVGELRPVKAFDVLIEALAILKQSGRTVTVTVAGEGPDSEKLQALALHYGVAEQIKFIGHCPARTAFSMGRIFAIPSRAESLPYVVLEAAAAGLPIIATDVGGVPEVFGKQVDKLIPPDDISALVYAIASALDHPDEMQSAAQVLRSRVRNEFSLSNMVESNLAAYREALAERQLAESV